MRGKKENRLMKGKRGIKPEGSDTTALYTIPEGARRDSGEKNKTFTTQLNITGRDGKKSKGEKGPNREEPRVRKTHLRRILLLH